MVSVDPRNWFRKDKVDPEYLKAVGMAGVAGSMKSGLPEEEWHKLLGVNLELIHDPWEERELERGSHFYGIVKYI